MAFSPDGKRLAAATAGFERVLTMVPGETVVWDWKRAKPRLTLRGYNGDVRAVAYSPDGKRLVTGGSDGWLQVLGTDDRPGNSHPIRRPSRLRQRRGVQQRRQPPCVRELRWHGHRLEWDAARLSLPVWMQGSNGFGACRNEKKEKGTAWNGINVTRPELMSNRFHQLWPRYVNAIPRGPYSVVAPWF